MGWGLRCRMGVLSWDRGAKLWDGRLSCGMGAKLWDEGAKL